MVKLTYAFLLIIILVSLGTVVYFSLSKSAQNTNSPSNLVVGTPTPNPSFLSTPSPVIVPTGWTTITNKVCGYQLSFPANFEYIENCETDQAYPVNRSCIESNDFKGSVTIAEDFQDYHGLAISIDCALDNSISSTLDIVGGCQAENNSSNVCKLETINNASIMEKQVNWRQSYSKGKFYTINYIIPRHFTGDKTQLDKILATFNFSN